MLLYSFLFAISFMLKLTLQKSSLVSNRLAITFNMSCYCLVFRYLLAYFQVFTVMKKGIEKTANVEVMLYRSWANVEVKSVGMVEDNSIFER